jgi:hypothetical protein
MRKAYEGLAIRETTGKSPDIIHYHGNLYFGSTGV